MGKQSRARRLQKDLPSARPGAQTAPLPPRTVPPSTERLALGLILFLGLLLRLAYLLEYRARSVYYGQLMLDAQVYENWARRIAGGEWLGGGVFYHAPLYPYLIALFFKVLGGRYLPIYLLQMLLGIVVLLLAYRVGRRCASGWIGIAAAALLLFYAPLPFFETKIMTTALALFLSTLALAALVGAWEKEGALPWLAAGGLIGLTALANPASLFLAPCFAAGLFFHKRRWRELGSLAAGCLLAVAPATLHNLAQGGGFVLISSQGGITFYQGNTPKSRGLYRAADGFSGSPLTQMEEEKTLAEKEVGHPLRASEVSSFWFGKGLQSIAAQPGAALTLMEMKLLRWFSSVEYSTEYSQSIEREELATLWIPILPFGLLAVGGFAGILLGYRAYPKLLPVTLYLAGTLVPPMIFYVSSRYRLPAVPALAVLTATALERIVARFRARGILDALPAILVILMASALTLAPFGRDHLFQNANVHYNTGNLYYDRGEYDAAIEQYRQALQVNDFEYYRINLGNALTRKGRYEEAIEQYRLASQRRPDFAKSYVQWAKALALQGKLEEARKVYQRALQLKSRSFEVEAMLSGTSQP